jgi:hypothetical protein
MYADFCHLVSEGKNIRFTKEHARDLMLQTRLRCIGLGDQSYRVSNFCLFTCPWCLGFDLVVKHTRPSSLGSVGLAGIFNQD